MKKIIIVSIGIVILFIGGLFWHFKKSPKSLEIIASKALADEGIDAEEEPTAIPREIVSKRTEKSKSFKNPDGTITTRIYQNAIHYQDEQGNWQEIDATFLPSDEPDYAYQMRDSIYKVKVKKDFDEKEFLEVTNNGLTYKITAAPLYWENEKGEQELMAEPQKVEGNIIDSSLIFKNAYGPGLDFEVVLDNEKFDKWLVIDRLAALGVPSEGLKAGGKVFLNTPIEISFSDKNIQLSQNGKELLPLTGKVGLLSNCSSCSSTELIVTGDFGSFGMHEPFYQESASWRTETENRHSLNWKLSQPDQTKLVFQMDFLTDWNSLQEARYPVKINADTVYYGEAADGYINGYNTVYSTARSTSSGCDVAGTVTYVGHYYYSGGNYGVYRSYFSFDTSAIPDTATVTAATLYICSDYTWYAQYGVEFLVKVYRYAWTEGLCSSQEANYDGAYGGSATPEGTLRNTADGWVAGKCYGMPVDTAGISKTGDSKYTLVSSRDVSGTAPTSYGEERVLARTADYADTTYDPYLDITYTEGGPPSQESDIIIFSE